MRSSWSPRRLGAAPLLVFSALVFLPAACGSSGPAADSPSRAAEVDPTAPPVLVVDGQVQVGCGGGAAWPASVMSAGLPGVLSQRQVEGAFTELLANPQDHGELSSSVLRDGPAATPWRVLRVDGDLYTLGLGRWTAAGPAAGASVMERQGAAGSWTWRGDADCQLAPVLASGTGWVRISPPRAGLDPQTSDPEIGVAEMTCSGARDVRPFLHDPFVEETSTTVTIYWTASLPTGSNFCDGAPPVDVPVQLSSPLGDRTLLDGSTYPPSPVRAR